jgi:hypothetical protein
VKVRLSRSSSKPLPQKIETLNVSRKEREERIGKSSGAIEVHNTPQIGRWHRIFV